MSAADEQRELLFVLRALEVLLSSGVGLEAGVHMIAKGGYGAVSEDFSKIMKGVGTGRTLEDELRAAKKRAVSEGYKRLINSLINNVTQNTDLVDTLRVQADRMEEERSEAVAAYIEELGDMPETLLTLGMLGPIVLSLVGLFPQLVGDSPIISMPPSSVLLGVVRMGLVLTAGVMVMVGLKAHTKDPGL